MTGTPIRKIKSLTLEDFRGFVGSHRIDCDADLVMIAGPNGHGKSSFMEALTLLLTGHTYRPKLTDLPSLDPAGEPKPRFDIKAKLDVGESAPVTGTVEPRAAASDGQKESEPASPFLFTPVLHSERIDDPELRARVCAFFQDRVSELFDEAARGRTYREVMQPRPLSVINLAESLSRKDGTDLNNDIGIIPDLDGARKAIEATEVWNDSDTQAQAQALAALWQSFRDALVPIRDFLPDIADHFRSDERMEEDGQAFLRSRGPEAPEVPSGELPRMFVREFRNLVDSAKKNAIRQGGRDSEKSLVIRSELEINKSSLDSINREFPHLADDLAWAGADGDARTPLRIFEWLAAHSSDWAKPPPGAADAIGRVLEEFGRVMPHQAAICAGQLRAWLKPRLEADAKRRDLEKEKDELEEKLRRAVINEQMERLVAFEAWFEKQASSFRDTWTTVREHRRHQSLSGARDEAKRRLAAAREAAETILEKLESYDPDFDKRLKEDLTRRTNRVLSRFTLVDGVYPLNLESVGASKDARPELHIVTRDGRRLEHLSTGQRAQVAVSLLTAQNQALMPYLDHHILLLDDVSTAYDLSNLAREAVLWRQLAYGGDDGWNRQRRQIFLSSHHEDLTSLMLDLLAPPKGRAMRLIRFTGWSPTEGPVFESFAVEPGETAAHGVADDDALKAALGAF